MELNLIAVFLILGISQGFISSILLFFSKDGSNRHNRILAALLAALGFSLLPTLLGQIGLLNRYDFLHLIPLNFTLFLFPLLYQYVLSVLRLNPQSKSSLIHYSAGIVFWCYTLLVWLLCLGVEEKGKILASIYFFEIQFFTQLVWTLMLIFYSKNIFDLLANSGRMRLSKSQQRYIPWAKRLFVFFISVGVIELVSILIGKYYGYWRGSPLDVWLGISLAIIIKCVYAFSLYLIGFIGYSRFRKITYLKNEISSTEVDSLLSKMTNAMEEDKQYLNPEFSLSDLALISNMSKTQVSSFLNNELNVSFNDFINRYRVQEVKKKLASDELDKYTLQSIAMSSGFKSKTTFYRAFQKITNQSPTAYIRQMKEH